MDALHVPGTSAAWPPFTHTTAFAAASPWNSPRRRSTSVTGAGIASTALHASREHLA